MRPLPERQAFQAAIKTATDAARPAVKPGDRVSRTRCGGTVSTFTFTHWDGDWMCGRTVSDCSAASVYAVNGQPTTFGDAAAIKATGDALCAAVNAEREARRQGAAPNPPERGDAHGDEIPW